MEQVKPAGQSWGVSLNAEDAQAVPTKDDGLGQLAAQVEQALAAIPDPEERVRSAFFVMNAISSRNWWKPTE